MIASPPDHWLHSLRRAAIRLTLIALGCLFWALLLVGARERIVRVGLNQDEWLELMIPVAGIGLTFVVGWFADDRRSRRVIAATLGAATILAVAAALFWLGAYGRII